MEPKKILLVILCFSPIIKSYKILGVFHTNSKSHYIAGGALMKALAEKGHEVTVISPFPQEQPLNNFHDITVPGIDRLRATSPNITEMEDMSFTEIMDMTFKFGIIMANFTLNHEIFQHFLHTNRVQYDVIVMLIFMNEPFLGLGHYFNAPIVGFSSFGASKWSNDMVDTPTPMSYVPHHFLVKFSWKMDFLQRFWNVMMYLSESAYMYWYYMPQQEKIYNKIFPDPKPTLDKLHKNVSLVLLNNQFSLHFPRPYVPNMIEVGGLQISRVQKELPSDLQKILDEAEDGVIYLSLGSNVKSHNFPIEKQRQLLNVFKQLKQKVLWKWDDLLPDKSDNVHISRWYPQNDLLAHRNTKLLITHGGLLSLTEAIYHSVPVIGIPLFADQYLNMAQAESAGYGLKIVFNDLNETSLIAAITKILTDNMYSEKVKLMSVRFRDQPLTPLETAIYWTEYVARHKGATHMRSPGLDLSFFAYHSLDVFASLFVTLLCVLYFVWRLIKWSFTLSFILFLRCKTIPKNEIGYKKIK